MSDNVSSCFCFSFFAYILFSHKGTVDNFSILYKIANNPHMNLTATKISNFNKRLEIKFSSKNVFVDQSNTLQKRKTDINKIVIRVSHFL